MINGGDIITAGGLMAWVDLGLQLIQRWIGPTVMLATAHFFLVDAAGRAAFLFALHSEVGTRRCGCASGSALGATPLCQACDSGRNGGSRKAGGGHFSAVSARPPG
jgi:hypothetical protein